MGFFHLPNIPIYEAKLTEEITNILWNYINKSEEKCTQYLAGNIEESKNLVDEDNLFFNNILNPIAIEYFQSYSHITSLSSNSINVKKFVLKEFWVNYMNKHEFNPIHNHGGVFSFVIWLKIPFDFKEQYNLPIAKKSNCPSVSDFSFAYTDILGQVSAYKINLTSNDNGLMMFFPSSLNHQVYPYFENNEQRISISGNLYWQ